MTRSIQSTTWAAAARRVFSPAVCCSMATSNQSAEAALRQAEWNPETPFRAPETASLPKLRASGTRKSRAMTPSVRFRPSSTRCGPACSPFLCYKALSSRSSGRKQAVRNFCGCSVGSYKVRLVAELRTSNPENNIRGGRGFGSRSTYHAGSDRSSSNRRSLVVVRETEAQEV